MFKTNATLSLVTIMASAPLAFAQDVPVESKVGFSEKKQDSDAYLEYVNYEQLLHSSSEGSVAGENTKLDMAFKYHPAEDSFFRVRYNTDPKKNPVENKTSKLELIMNHQLSDFELQVDLDITDDGQIQIGPDTDSDYTFLSYKPTDDLSLTLYPFNFNGELGSFFYINDVSRIYYIEGTPDTIPNQQPENVSIRTKTLPGFDVKYQATEELTVTVGFSSGRYLYPADPDFVLEEDVVAESWQAKSDTGYKIGLDYAVEGTRARFKYVTHDSADETGSLLQSAANLQAQQSLGAVTIGFEAAYSKAGEKAYFLDYDSKWFKEASTFRPIFSDDTGELQDWLGQEDYAYQVNVSYHTPNFAPYAYAASLGENFVFWEDESVHLLRTNDRSESHGGLQMFGVGVKLKRGNYTITPEYEYLVAKNDVFTNKSDLREQESLVNRNNKQSRFTIYMNYEL